ncbi:MAG: ABC transporter ATP-binding protein [Clostridia bacterium]|nr:ABC transporter ATP-binding protein [Clostridia bacterium]
MTRNRYDIDEALERHIDFSKLKRIGKYIAPHTKKMLFALFLVICSSILSLTVPSILQTVIDEVIPSENVARLVKLSVFAASAIIFSSLLATLRNVIMAHVGQAVVYNIRRDLFAHLQDLPFTYYDSRPHGKILVRVVNYVNAVSNVMTNGLLTAAVDLLNIVFIACFMFSMDKRLTLYVLAGLPVLLLFTVILKRFQKKYNTLQNNKSSNLTAYTCEAIAGVKVTQIFNRQKENKKIYKRLNDVYHHAWMRMAITSNFLSPITELLKQCAVGLVYIAGAVWLSGDAVSAVEVGVLIAMGTYAARFWQPFISLANIYTNFITTLTYLERIFQTLDEPVEIESKEGAHLLESIKGEVELKNLTFGYEENAPVLKDLSMHVKAGQSVALVGETGSGKTTIVNLISRFYNVSDGMLFIDGHDINDLDVRSLRSHMGIMMQDSFIFSGTIADNIRYGKLDATDEEVQAAARAVCADEFIREMPQGYETVVNERGGMLSQGQKQLIAFARTMLSDPGVLILDEATSSIDAKTERLLQKGIEALLAGRTSFIIAHRLSTIRHCDCIYYLENGKILESGTHEELLEKKGKYHHLCTVQANN